MENALLWFSALTGLLTGSAGALCAVVSWRRVSAYTSPVKRVREMEVRLADLESSLDSTIATLRKMSSRQSMRDLRARASADTPPVTKEEAKRRYLYGRTHQQIALAAMNGGQSE